MYPNRGGVGRGNSGMPRGDCRSGCVAPVYRHAIQRNKWPGALSRPGKKDTTWLRGAEFKPRQLGCKTECRYITDFAVNVPEPLANYCCIYPHLIQILRSSLAYSLLGSVRGVFEAQSSGQANMRNLPGDFTSFTWNRQIRARHVDQTENEAFRCFSCLRVLRQGKHLTPQRTLC